MDRTRRLALLGRKIFGQVQHPPGVKSPTRWLKKANRAEAMLKYYPQIIVNQNRLMTRMAAAGLYFNEKMFYHEQKVADMRERGKVPTKKGEGKRAAKKKKK
eukprot:m.18162 g.18162  ORF g.18162 m.18162 type:complete len:102 (-) comp7705_c0_seq1:271-576(-)